MRTQPTQILDVAYRTPEFDEALRRLRTDPDALPGTAVVLTEVPAGVSKKMATDVAERVGLDLYRIDVTAFVGTCVAETEKNLDRLLARAESSHAILFFDEADALFDKRTDVNSAHERYSTFEVSYLLKKLETYAGPSIMVMSTAEAQSAIGACLRRVRVRYRAS